MTPEAEARMLDEEARMMREAAEFAMRSPPPEPREAFKGVFPEVD